MNFKISKLFNNFLIILLLSGVEIFAQSGSNQQPCGTPATSFEELQKKFYFGNNDTLYRILANLPQIRQEVHGSATPIANRVWRDDNPSIIWSVPVTFWAATPLQK
ncbi:MAG: hypothetical protein ACOVQA_14990 [Thermoflexibacteraceae bacterium]